MEAKYQKYYDALKGVNLTSATSGVTSGCSTLESTTKKLESQISSSTWEELGAKQIKTTILPAFEQAVGILKANCDVLNTVGSEVATLVSLLESLESACNSYQNCPNDEEHAQERSSRYSRMKEYESKVDSQISKINGLSGSIQEIKVEVQNTTSETAQETQETTTEPQTTQNTAAGEFVYYRQGDYKQSYGGGKTIAQAGCGPTSLAMVLTYYTGKKITPVDTANYAMKHGYRIIGNGTSDKLFDAMCKDYGLNGEYQKATSSNIVTALKQGKKVIAHMGKGTFTNGGHYIVLKGITSDGKVLVADPNHPNFSDRTFSADLIARESKGRMYTV